ncbi:MAG: hypothetical protein CML68_17785 [Rhodobacteraceae bacterium]|nr:hypothetical protein [Paracoccaceae bacterium]
MRPLAFLILFLLGGPACATDRAALVIGNSVYTAVPDLANPANDASDIGAKLEKLGFDVVVGLDVDAEEMRQLFQSFSTKAETADVSLVYFAGHGIEVDRSNYLIPVDAQLSSDVDVQFEAIPLDLLMQGLARSDGVKLVLVDACRNNPFADRLRETDGTRSIGVGLGRVDPIGGVSVGGVLVSYAAREGALAFDGKGRNSPYAQALLESLDESGLEVSRLFRNVRDRVMQLTDGLQEPFTYGSLPSEPIYLSLPAAGAGPEDGNASFERKMAADFFNAEQLGSAYYWERFLQKYSAQSDHELVALARKRLKERSLETDRDLWASTRDPWLETRFDEETGAAELALEQRVLVQDALTMMGHDIGATDGVFGPKTRRAISTTRVVNGLNPGDKVDLAFLRLLPNVPGIRALQNTLAVSYDEVDLPEPMEPRLERVFETMGPSKFKFDYHRGHLYVVTKKGGRTTWGRAQNIAQQAGGYLAAIGSAEENQFIHDLFSTDPKFTHQDYSGSWFGPMFGLFQVDKEQEPAGGWTWINGERLDFVNWARGRPDNFDGRQDYGRFFRAPGAETENPAITTWDDMGAGLWCCGYVIEVE